MKINLYPKYLIRSLFAKDKRSFFSAGYKLLYPEYSRHGMTPWQHYVVDGRRKGYCNGNSPSDGFFFREGYELEYPDVKKSGEDAWRHFALKGNAEGRDNGLHPDVNTFFAEGYIAMYPDVAKGGIDSWHHYVLHGKAEGRDNGLHPNGDIFFPEGYLAMYPDIAKSGMDPWRHYVMNGKAEGRDNGLHPNGEIFFPEGYLAMYPDIAKSGTDPWRDYVLHGKAEGRDNGLHPEDDLFFEDGYLLMYPDIAKSGVDPWRHYIAYGKKEGRDNGNHPSSEVFFTEGYRLEYPDAEGDSVDLWREYISKRGSEGRDNGLHPSKDLFFADGYLAMYTDVADAKLDPWRHYVLNGKKEGRDNGNHTDKFIQNAMWGCFSNVRVKVDNKRPVCVNIVMPELFKHASAGPLSIMYFARFLLQNNYNVRLLMLTDKDPKILKDALRYQNDDISEISGRLEVESLQIQKDPEVAVNEHDMSVATLFNTANTANLIQKKCRNKKFIYFIQDDEREFFPASSLRAAVEQSYAYDCYPIFSTKILQDFFLSEDVGRMKSKHAKVMWQGCPANYHLPSFEKFSQRTKKKFVFYARPNNPRNCYGFAFILLIEAINRKIFDDSWEFYGIGFPKSCDLKLPGGKNLHMLPNMSLEEYKESLSTYDVALSLMSTPHPSMPPVDFALSGCLVVTNTYKNKTEKVLSEVSKNIISAPLLFDPLMKALEKAVSLSDDLELRYKNAMSSYWPKSWDSALDRTHAEWIKDIMESQDE